MITLKQNLFVQDQVGVIPQVNQETQESVIKPRKPHAKEKIQLSNQ